MERVKRNELGMSLIEVLIAMVLLLIVGLALMQTANVALLENVKNTVRDEAISVAEVTMNDLRARSWTAIPVYMDSELNNTFGVLVPATTPTVTRHFRNFQIDYGIRKAITDVGTDIKQVTVEVKWTTRGQEYNHTITNIVRKQ